MLARLLTVLVLSALAVGILIGGVAASHTSAESLPGARGNPGPRPRPKDRIESHGHRLSGEPSVRPPHLPLVGGGPTHPSPIREQAEASPNGTPLDGILAMLWKVAFFALLALAAFCETALCTRWLDRRHRRHSVYQLKAYRDEVPMNIGIAGKQGMGKTAPEAALVGPAARRDATAALSHLLAPSPARPSAARPGSKPPVEEAESQGLGAPTPATRTPPGGRAEQPPAHPEKVRECQSVVGALGEPMRVPISLLLESLEDFENVDRSYRPKHLESSVDRPTRSAAGLEARARALASGSELKQEQVRALRWFYEFNYMTSQQLALVMGASLPTVSRRTKQMLEEGLIRGLAFHKQGGRMRVWHLTDFGHRVGRNFNTRRGAILPAATGWREHSPEASRSIGHDLHAVAYVLGLAALVDGPGDPLASTTGLIVDIKGARGATLKPPPEYDGQERVPLTPRLLAGLEPELVLDSPGELDGFGRLVPDAAIFFQDSPDGDGEARSQLLLELDRSGHRPKLIEKFRRYDAFYAAWAPRHPQTRKRPPATLFVARDEVHLRRHLAIADQVLCIRRGSYRTPSAEWPAPPSRRRIFFALERDLHQGTLRCYRLPEHPPAIREAGARNERDRAAARRFTPASIDLLPARFLFERRHPSRSRGV